MKKYLLLLATPVFGAQIEVQGCNSFSVVTTSPNASGRCDIYFSLSNPR